MSIKDCYFSSKFQVENSARNYIISAFCILTRLRISTTPDKIPRNELAHRQIYSSKRSTWLHHYDTSNKPKNILDVSNSMIL